MGIGHNPRIIYQLTATALGLILLGGAFFGSAQIAFADDDDRDKKKNDFKDKKKDIQEKIKILKELIKKSRDKHNDDDEKKVLVCHIPPGNPQNAHTIRISENAVQTHLDHGDSLGICDKYGEIQDKKNPKIKITFPEKKQEIEGPTVMITGTASDDHSGIKKVLVRIDNGQYKEADFDSNAGTWKFTTGELDPGKHKVKVKAEDNADNIKRAHDKFVII